MKSSFLRKELRLTVGWFIATAIGFVLGEVFLTSLTFRFVPSSLLNSKFDWFGIMLGVASGIAIGFSVGVFQWLILRNYLSHSWLWIAATLLGMTSGYFIEGFIWVAARYYLSMYVTAEFWTLIKWITPFIEGLVIGLTQWVVLRKFLSKSWTWVIMNGFSWTLALAIGKDIIRPIFYPCCFDYFLSPVSESIIYGAVGTLFGIVTGSLLAWLLRQNNSMVQTAA
jgi:hypothetical protein